MSNIIHFNFKKDKPVYTMPDPHDPNTWGNDKYIDTDLIIKNSINNDDIYDIVNIISSFAGKYTYNGKDIFCCSQDIPKNSEYWEGQPIPDHDYETYLTSQESSEKYVIMIAIGINDNSKIKVTKIPRKLKEEDFNKINILVKKIVKKIEKSNSLFDFVFDDNYNEIIITPLNKKNTSIKLKF